MDEATKILIGTISGFIVAFLAEPVKTYFQTTRQIKNLRRMLYQETLENYSFLQKMPYNNTSTKDYLYLAKTLIKTSAYEYAISNEITLYYQLKEAVLFNRLYSLLDPIFKQEVPSDFQKVVSNLYKELLSKAINSKEMDMNLLRKLRNKKEIEEILKT